MLSHYSDIHLFALDLRASIFYPGPRAYSAQDDDVLVLGELLRSCQAMTRPDFMIEFRGETFRGRRDENGIDGLWFRLRRIARTSPTLDSLPSSLPAGVVDMLLSDRLLNGGLVYIVGSPGHGKTTTASATVASRLAKFGGIAYTLEDPPEMALNGWHGKGYCSQNWVGNAEDGGWSEAFRGTLRSQPAGTPCMLYIGEVRDEESALALIRAAMNGFFTIGTGFGADIVSALEALLKMAGDTPGNRSALSGVLRLVLHQQIQPANKILKVTSLASASASSSIAARIRDGNLRLLQTEIEQQAARALHGKGAFDAQDPGSRR